MTINAVAPPRLEVTGLSKTYGTGATARCVIEDLTFTVNTGEVVCIVGPSGCGKTTLLRCLAGLHPPRRAAAMTAARSRAAAGDGRWCSRTTAGRSCRG